MWFRLASGLLVACLSTKILRRRMGEAVCTADNSKMAPQANQVVLVTGGSGFLGQHIVKHLQERAPQVREIRVFDLKPYQNKLGHEENKPVRTYLGDVRMISELREAARGADAVIHTAGFVSLGTFPDVDKMRDINVRGTENVIRACVEEGVPRLVHTSTIDVVVGSKAIVNGDETLRRPRRLIYAGYGGSKADAEERAISAHGRRNKGNGPLLRTVALRPNVMYGEEDPVFITSALKRAAKEGGQVRRVGDGSALYQQAYVGNVAWAHVVANEALARDASLGGRAYFITDDTPVRNVFDLLQPFLAAKGFTLSEKAVPYQVAYWGIRLAELVVKVLKPFIKLELTADSCSIRYINQTLTYSRKAAEENLGYTPIYSYDDAMERSLRFYKGYDCGEKRLR